MHHIGSGNFNIFISNLLDKIERTKFNAFRFTQNSQFYSNKTDVIEGRVHLMDFLKWFF